MHPRLAIHTAAFTTTIPLHELDDFLGNRSKHQQMPAGDAVRGNHDQIDMFALNHIHDASRDVISNFDTGTCLDPLAVGTSSHLQSLTWAEAP